MDPWRCSQNRMVPLYAGLVTFTICYSTNRASWQKVHDVYSAMGPTIISASAIEVLDELCMAVSHLRPEMMPS